MIALAIFFVLAQTPAPAAKPQKKIEIIKGKPKKTVDLSRDDALAAKEQQLKEKERALDEKNQQLDDKNRTLETKSKDLDAREEALKNEKEEQARRNEAQHKAAEKVLQDVQSTSGSMGDALGGN
jgi:hypothetical protein